MNTQWTLRTWLGWVVFFFAWAFAVHGADLVLHEAGGHGVAATIAGCGVDRFDLTYFGNGQTSYKPCPEWTWTRLATRGSAGLAVAISAGAVAMAFQRRARLSPLARLLVALLATWFLLGELAYATSGGFHELYDARWVAGALAFHGLRVLAWLPPLVLFAASAVSGARAIVTAFREHFRSRSRLHALKQMAATLGVAGLLHLSARYAERYITVHLARTTQADIPQSVMARAEEIAAARSRPSPFPMDRVLVAIGVAAFLFALARPVVRRDRAEDAAPSAVPRRHAIGVAVAALVCFIAITSLSRMHR